MNEEITQKVINHLLGENKRLTAELIEAINLLEECLNQYTYTVQEYNALKEKYNAVTGKMSKKSEKNKNSLDPDFSSVINSFNKS